MTTITLEIPDELAARLAPIKDQLPKLLAITIELVDTEHLQIDDERLAINKAKRLAALTEASAIGKQIRSSQQERGVKDISSIILLNELRENRDYDLAGLH